MERLIAVIEELESIHSSLIGVDDENAQRVISAANYVRRIVNGDSLVG